MLKFASSVVANISDTLGPLVRSPLDSATLNWTKIEYAVQAVPNDDFNPAPIVQSINQLVEALRKDDNDRRGSSLDLSDHSSNQSVVSFLSEANAIAVLASAALNNKKAALTGICIKAIDALLSVTTSPLLQSPGSLSSLLSLTTDLIESDSSSRLHRSSLIALARSIALKVKEDELTATEFNKLLHLEQSNARSLIEYLIQHINHWSANGQNACIALLDLSCASGPGSNIGVVIANSTQFSNLLVAGLCELTAQLPPISECPPFKTLWTDNPAAASFIQRLEFIDRSCHLAPSIISNQLGHEFHEQFLDLVLAPMILDVREDNSCWATIFMFHCCVRVTHPIPMRAIARFVLGSEVAASKSHILVRRTLIQRIDSLSERLCQSTLQLFTAICQFRDPSIVDALVTASPDASRDVDLNSLECLQPLQLVAGDLRHHSEYSDYLLDAQSEQLKWQAADSNPRALPNYQWNDSEERTLFITTLMNKLDSIFENSLATNLRLAALITSIASCPSLNSHLAVYHQMTERSLLTSLTSLTVAAKRRASRLSQFDKRLSAAQRRIQEALDSEQDRSTVQRKGSSSSPSSLQSDGLYIVSGHGKGESLIGVEPLDIERFLAGRCILEAICIQLVAIKDNQRRTLKVPTSVELPIAEPASQRDL